MCISLYAAKIKRGGENLNILYCAKDQSRFELVPGLFSLYYRCPKRGAKISPRYAEQLEHLKMKPGIIQKYGKLRYVASPLLSGYRKVYVEKEENE